MMSMGVSMGISMVELRNCHRHMPFDGFEGGLFPRASD